jgi:hypothetical protein
MSLLFLPVSLAMASVPPPLSQANLPTKRFSCLSSPLQYYTTVGASGCFSRPSLFMVCLMTRLFFSTYATLPAADYHGLPPSDPG